MTRPCKNGVIHEKARTGRLRIGITIKPVRNSCTHNILIAIVIIVALKQGEITPNEMPGTRQHGFSRRVGKGPGSKTWRVPVSGGCPQGPTGSVHLSVKFSYATSRLSLCRFAFPRFLGKQKRKALVKFPPLKNKKKLLGLFTLEKENRRTKT